MKKITLLFLLLLSVILSNAQMQLWGMTGGGGSNSEGTVFKCAPSDSATTTIVSFDGNNGARPFSSLIQAPDGYIYGMTQTGGPTDDGTIFKCTPSGNLTTIANFNNRNGSSPYGDLLYGNDGNLYGMTPYGGKFDSGTIFQCTPSGVINTLVSFDGNSGLYPYGSLIQGTDGDLYGMAMYGGGEGDSGTIFRCTTTGVITALVNFNSINGGYPFGSLIQASDGYLYGMTLYGGLADSGVIFKCSTTGQYTVLVNLNAQTGCYPFGNLIQAYDGNLYGMTQLAGANNGGTLFKITPSGVFTILQNFNSTIGETPLGSLIQTADSSLYGMTTSGGNSGAGNIFQYNTSGRFTNITELIGALYACSPVKQYGKLLVVNPVLGISEITAKRNIIAYPNPAHDVLNIICPDAGKIKINILDVTGKQVMNINTVADNKEIPIAINGLSSGIYFTEVISCKNKQVFKFVKE